MFAWTAEDFNFIKGRMEKLKTEKAENLAETGSEPSQTNSEASRAANDFSAINQRVKTLERDGALLS